MNSLLKDFVLGLKLLIASVKLRLSDGSDLKKLQDYIDILEQAIIVSPNATIQLAKSDLESFDRGLNKKAGFDCASEIDSNPEFWLELKHLDDEWVQNALNIRERLRMIANQPNK